MEGNNLVLWAVPQSRKLVPEKKSLETCLFYRMTWPPVTNTALFFCVEALSWQIVKHKKGCEWKMLKDIQQISLPLACEKMCRKHEENNNKMLLF